MTLYHVLNRGVERRKIFMESDDRIRFVHSLFEFNDTHPANNTEWHLARANNDIVSRYSRERIVDIHGWCLMKNHYHLLLSERIEGGLTQFIRKLNVGYAKFFNTKYKRTGTLFEGRTKKVPVTDHAHALYILHYVHLNPLDYLKGATRWRERDRGGVRDISDALAYLKTYRWSSYLDYVGAENFPSMVTTDFFSTMLGNYEESVTDYLKTTEADQVRSINLKLE